MPVTSSAHTPVVFVHGLWMHASSWAPWLELFTENGYAPTAPGWPGDGETVAETRANPGALDNVGLTEVTDQFATIIRSLPAPPIVVGHSFGGLIAQKLLGMGITRACIALAPAQFKGILGLPLAQLQSVAPILTKPWLRTKTWSHTPDSFAKNFANGVTRAESDELFSKYVIAAPCRPLFQAGLANFTPKSAASVDTKTPRGPLLLLAGGLDRMVPAATVRAEYRIQARNSGVTEFAVVEGRGHSFPADSGWREVASRALDFLARNGL